MKLQIDTLAKTIKVDETVKIVELIKVIKKLLPDEWQSYSLETGITFNWYNPIPWYYNQPWTLPAAPAFDPYKVTCDNNGYSSTSIYNVECIN